MDIKAYSDDLISWGSQRRIQDLYIESFGEHWRIQFRKGDAIIKEQELTEAVAIQLLTRFKYLGDMDVGETRKVQLGAIRYPLPEGYWRLRLSLVGDYRLQESMVIRFLYPIAQEEQCFLLKEQYPLLKQNIQRRGLYLFAGATGSGKTTLMYRLAKEQVGRVLTIEDPVEIEEPSFTQLQVNPTIGQTYDRLIQLALRHRPDILIIGEIRDRETAQAAIRAALTGCRVFATVHASSIAATRGRIRDLVGSESELADSLLGIVYQRLLQTKTQLGALLAYEFVGKEVAHGDWQTNLEKLFYQGEIAEECFLREI